MWGHCWDEEMMSACRITISSQVFSCKYHMQRSGAGLQHLRASQHTAELAVGVMLSSRSRQHMSEDDVKKKSCKYWRCFWANSSSYNLSNSVDGWNPDRAEVRDKSAADSRGPRSPLASFAACSPQSWLGLMVLFCVLTSHSDRGAAFWQWVR